jgi:NAD(P)-dependent dehydrogenase (short-subunit alcohol dehydrogenase family)
MRLDGKVTIITGGGSGMGKTAAELFAAQGAKVVVADYAEASGEAVVAAVRAAGGEATFVRADVSSEGDARGMVQHAVATFGRVDALYNNAGIMPEADHSVIDTDVDTWDKVMAVNVRGAFLCCHYAVPRMIERGGGAIVNTSSLAGKVGSAVTGSHYATSKAGIIGFTKILAREVAGYGIRVNGVAPGRIDTPMIWDVPREVNEQYVKTIPLKRLGKAEDVADGILFLLSDASSYITGLILDINGGLAMTY